jgi:LuxR family transcriptional regulator, maltose regulon positive regulatory protein
MPGEQSFKRDGPLTKPRSMGSAIGPPAPDVSRLGGKQLQFLATKVVPPRFQGLIERPRLLGMISQLSTKRLAVIKGPAGFGKTSLAAGWAQELQRPGNAVAWLTIDRDDDEPTTFVFYVCHALQRASESLGTAALDLIQESFLINPRAVISALINDLADLDDEIYLFLEDYHWIGDSEIHESLAFFLKNAPSHCHLILTTRTEPDLPLASLRAQNQLLEIDASALRFDLQEARDFIEAALPETLVPADVRLLVEKTEGWPAALRILASTSARTHENFGEYLRKLSGTLRPIGAYLEELLDGLPRDLFRFMLRTAILDRFCVPLCEAVTGAKVSQDLLASIEKRQLLLTPLDQEGRWFRYHPLLAEYLGQRLGSELGNEIPGLHQRASQWYAAQELWTDAVQHAIAAGDSVRALEWIKNCAMPLVKRGDLFTLLGWQRLFPPGLLRGQPEIGLAIAWGMALAVRSDEALELVGDLERDVDASRTDAFQSECEAIRSVALALKDHTEPALSIAQDCLGRTTDPWCANVASNVVRFGHLKRGDLKKYYATPWIAYSLDEDRRNVFAAVYYRCLQGMAEAQQLRIASAERYQLDALRLAEEHVGPNSVAAALPASLIARLRYEQGRLDEAESMLIDRVPLINAGTLLDCVLSSYFVMARIAIHKMNLARAHTLLEWAENQGNARGWGRLSAAAVFERARLCLNEGRIDEAVEHLNRLDRLAVQYPAPNNCAWSDIQRYATFGRAYAVTAQGRFDEAISILAGLRRELESVDDRLWMLKVEMLTAAVMFKTKQVAEALEAFGRIVAVAAKAGIHHTILDEGTIIGPLLLAYQETVERAGGSAELTPYLSNLVAAWRRRYGSEPQQQSPSSSSTAGGLSPREGDILKLVADGLSNKEIARDLAIAPETVKSHIKHIFIKLNVERRAQAVSRAQMLGLADTPR